MKFYVPSCLHWETYNLPKGHHQWNRNSCWNGSKIFRVIFRPKINVTESYETKCQQLKLTYEKCRDDCVEKNGAILSLPNKILLYKCTLKPILTYSIQFCAYTKPSYTNFNQRGRSNKILHQNQGTFTLI